MNPSVFAQRLREHVPYDWIDAAVEEIARHMETDGGHDFGHLYRVFLNAGEIARRDGRSVDLEALTAAVLFHDFVNLPKNHPERALASTYSAAAALKFLRVAAPHLTDAALRLVDEAIKCHSFSAGLKPQSYEARVLSDADKLESLGALGLARVFYVAGRMGNTIVDMQDPRAEHRELDDRRFAMDHFPSKLFLLRDMMHTEGGRQVAEQRHDFMVSFVSQFHRELGLEGDASA